MFWDTLPRPFFVSAPLKDVTDAAFRALLAKRGKPDVMWTEFVSADGLYHTIEHSADRSEKSSAQAARPIQYDFSNLSALLSTNPLLRDLQYSAAERPIVAQLFSAKPEMIAYAAKLAEEFGFDGVDINMGCPDRSVEKQGSGAALIKSPALARELIRAAKGATSLPVSVKTRVGYNKEMLDEWLPELLAEEPAAITLHLRTRKELSLVRAHWELMPRAVEIRDRVNPRVLLIGNGDLTDLDDARAKVAESGCDGAMIGRGMFGNPWVFAGKKASEVSTEEKFDALIELAYAFEQISPPKHFSILKKHIKAFITGFDGAAPLRAQLMNTTSATELERTLRDYQL